MDIVAKILVVLHIVGFGVVFGGALAQLPNLKKGAAKVSAGMMHGSWLLLATGLLLVGVAEMGEGDSGLNHMKIGVKLVVLLAIIVLVLVNRKKPQVSGGVIGAIAGLSAVNVCLAVLWS